MSKSVTEYREEIEKIRRAMAAPGVSPEESKIYTDAISRIQKLIETLECRAGPQAQTGSVERRATTPAREERQPAPFRVIKAGERQVERQPASAQPSVVAGAITAAAESTLKTVAIDWGHGRTETLTEGECRGRFTTALRDLAQSRLARQERFTDCAGYITFDRAVAYYRGLILFWGAAPSPTQLQIHPLGRVKTILFNMITASAQEEEAQSGQNEID